LRKFAQRDGKETADSSGSGLYSGPYEMGINWSRFGYVCSVIIHDKCSESDPNRYVLWKYAHWNVCSPNGIT